MQREGCGEATRGPWVDEVVEESEYAVYQDHAPFVREVRWSHPRIVAAMRGLAPGWRSVHAYPEWAAPYGLEDASPAGEVAQRNARVRNFIRVLLGELRDHPRLLEGKLRCLAHQVQCRPDELGPAAPGVEPFSRLTYPAYRRLVELMRVSQELREALAAHPNDTFNYCFGDADHRSARRERPVPPWTDREMAFAFSKYLGAGAPSVSNAEGPLPPGSIGTWKFELERKAALAQPRDDLEAMYTFRGHIIITPLWLESNAFIWNSRRGGRAWRNRGCNGYYLHPFRERYQRARQAWATYLFHKESDYLALRHASDEGGGPVIYLTDEDAADTGLARYRLFRGNPGHGEQTDTAPDPRVNANMVPWDLAASTASESAAVQGWRPDLLSRSDLGFSEVFPTFERRMARLCQALDRHTNWGPTGYSMLEASRKGALAHEIEFLGAYSPLVATSYDLSASHEFAVKSRSPGFEADHVKWIHVVRFPRARYLDVESLRAGRILDFDRDWFSEPSLSNDYYCERGLDRFGWVPEDELCANLYLVYGSRGEAPPALEDIPETG